MESSPNSHPDDAIITDEIHRLLARLKRLGIDDVRSGIEIEFSPGVAANGFNPDIKNKMLERLRKEGATSQEQMSLVEAFMPGAVFYYDLITDPAIKDLLEPLNCGPLKRVEDFLDSEVHLELRIRYESLPQLFERYDKVQTVMRQKFAEHGLTPGKGFCHQAFSLWKNGENTTLSEHPEYERYTPRMAEGMLNSWFYGMGLTASKEYPEVLFPSRLKLDHTRDMATFIRVAKGRLEVRPCYRMNIHENGYENYNPRLASLITLAGIVFALDPIYQKKFEVGARPARIREKAIYQNPHPQMESVRKKINSLAFEGNEPENESRGVVQLIREKFMGNAKIIEPTLSVGDQASMLHDHYGPDNISVHDALKQHDVEFGKQNLPGPWYVLKSIISAPRLSELPEQEREKMAFARVKTVALVYNDKLDKLARELKRPIYTHLFQEAAVFKAVLNPSLYDRFSRHLAERAGVDEGAREEALNIIAHNTTLAQKERRR